MKSPIPFKISIINLCAFLISAFCSNSLSAQEPFDNCNEAWPLHCGFTNFSSTVGATVSAFPDPSCFTLGSLEDKFFSFTAFPDYIYTITVNGENYDGVLLAYTGGCDSPTEIACADNGLDDNIAEVITVSVTFTQTVLVRTYDYNSDGGLFGIGLQCETTGNDFCSNAIEILAHPTATTRTAISGSTIGATSSGTPNPNCSFGSMNDVFYKINASPGLDYTVRVYGSNYDGVLAAYTGTCSGSLNQIACADNGISDGIEEIITFSVEEPQVVLIQTYDYQPSGGNFNIGLISVSNNSSCSAAATINCGEALIGKMNESTASGIEPPICDLSASAVSQDVFYKIYAQPGQIYEITSTPVAYWSGLLVAYAGFDGLCGDNLVEIACAKAMDPESSAVIEFSVTTAQPILIRTYDFVNSSGTFTISLDCLPLNSACENALPVVCGTPVSGTTVGATESGIPLPSCTDGTPADIFYALEALPNINYTATINGTNYDAVIAAYIGECDGTLTELACADNGLGSNIPETIEFSVETAKTVLIRTYDWFSNQGDFTLEVTCENENQSCANAIPIDLYGQSECPDNAVIYSNEGSETSVETCDDDFSPHTVFFSFNSESNQSVNFDFNDITITDWIVQLVENCNGDVQYCGIGINSVNVAVNPNTEYTLTVSTNSFVGSPGTFALCATGLNDFCVDLGGFIGEPCDDGNPQTTNDVIQEDCGCQGTISSTVLGSVSWNSSCGSRSGSLNVYHAGTTSLAGSYNVVVNADGNFTAPFNQFGNFDFILKLDGYISSGVAFVTLNTPETSVFFGAQVPGDLNGNNTVNVIDLSLMSIAFGSSSGDSNYDPLADYNCNGTINVADISILNGGFGFMGVTAPLTP